VPKEDFQNTFPALAMLIELGLIADRQLKVLDLAHGILCEHPSGSILGSINEVKLPVVRSTRDADPILSSCVGVRLGGSEAPNGITVIAVIITDCLLNSIQSPLQFRVSLEVPSNIHVQCDLETGGCEANEGYEDANAGRHEHDLAWVLQQDTEPQPRRVWLLLPVPVIYMIGYSPRSWKHEETCHQNKDKTPFVIHDIGPKNVLCSAF